MIVTAIDSRGWTALTFAVGSRRAECVDAVVAIIERVGPPKQVRCSTPQGNDPSVDVFADHGWQVSARLRNMPGSSPFFVLG